MFQCHSLKDFGPYEFGQSNPHSYRRNPEKSPSGSRVFLGFKLHCVANTLVFPPKRLGSSYGKKKARGGILPSILKSLNSEENVEKALSLYVGKLGPKEQTLILKEQRSWEKVLHIFNWIRSQHDYSPNVIHYNVVLRALGRAQRWDELRLCWIEMARDGVGPTNNTYSMLVDVYGKAGLINESLLWVKHMMSRGIFPDEVSMNTIVKVLKDAGEFDKADMFYKDWCVSKVNLQSLYLDDAGESAISLKNFLSTELFKVGGRYPQPEEAVLIENSVRKPQLTTTYNTLIDLYGKAGRLKDAGEVFSQMLKEGVGPDTVTFNTMIHTCGSHGHLLEAEALLFKMEERGLSPDTKTYNILLSLHAKAGNIDSSLKWYRKIREVDLLPNTVTHRAILHMLCEEHMVEEAESVMIEMEKCNLCVDEHCVPGIMKMYVEEGHLDKARAFFEKYRVVGSLSSKTIAAIMDVYAEKGLWSDAETVFHSKRARDQKRDVLEYNVMIKAYGKVKLYEKALLVFEEMRNSGTWPDECTYNSLIQMFAGGDLVDHANDVLTQMQEAGLTPHGQTYSALIASYVRQGLLSDAITVFHDMESAGLEPNEVVYGTLINGFAEAGRTEDALYYYRKMQDVGITVNQIVLTALVKAYTKAGCLKEAKEMYKLIEQFEGGPDIVASNSMLNLYADLGIVPDAMVIYENLRKKSKADGITFITMIKLYRNLEMLDNACKVAQEMKESGLLTNCALFNKALACYAANSQLSECGELIKEMVTHKILLNNSTFKILFTILKKGGIPSEAVKQLESAYREEKSYVREAIMTCVFVVLGLKEFAIEMSDKYINTGVQLNRFAYNAAIYAYGTCGQTDKALNVFMRMLDEAIVPDVVTYIYLVDCYGRMNMVEGVKRIYGQIKYQEIELNESLINAIVNAYRNANRHDLAQLVSHESKLGFESNRYSESDVEWESEEEM